MRIDLIRLHDKEPRPLSNRAFGLIFAGVFLFFAILPLLTGSGQANMWATYVSMAFASLALLVPAILGPLNMLWSKFGAMMHRITDPLLMGMVFTLTVVPTGLVLKILRKDPMRRDVNTDSTSYWIKREHGTFTKTSFENQF